MSETDYYWWLAYGHFAPGENNLPCIGQVIEYYFALSGLSKKEFADIIGNTERYVEMLKSSQNKEMPQLLSRRILLAKVLHIPPILLGLSSVTLLEWGDATNMLQGSAIADVVASSGTMMFYERMLALGWELYYTSTVQRAAENIRASFILLNDEALNATGVKKDQYDALRCRFYQLSSLVSRDSMQTNQALDDMNEAVSIAIRLKNAELIASSLLRRARVYIRHRNYEFALKDAEIALPYADLSRDPLKGKCYQMAGEAQAYLAEEDKTLQEKSISYFDKAGRILRKGNLEPDGSFVKLDFTSLYIERAKALRLFGRYHEAHHALAIARKNLSPDLTRWHMNLLIEEAKTYADEKQVSDCCEVLREALKIVRVLKLQDREIYITQLYQRLKNAEPNNYHVGQLGKDLAV